MADRRTFLTAAGLAAIAAGTGAVASGCAKPIQLGTGATTAQIPASSVPVGGGIVLADARFVVTQPTAGQYRAFDRTCTHSDCPLKGVVAGVIQCKCHGSRFSIVDGSVLEGPATKPLIPRTLTVRGETLELSP